MATLWYTETIRTEFGAVQATIVHDRQNGRSLDGYFALQIAGDLHPHSVNVVTDKCPKTGKSSVVIQVFGPEAFDAGAFLSRTLPTRP